MSEEGAAAITSQEFAEGMQRVLLRVVSDDTPLKMRLRAFLLGFMDRYAQQLSKHTIYVDLTLEHMFGFDPDFAISPVEAQCRLIRNADDRLGCEGFRNKHGEKILRVFYTDVLYSPVFWCDSDNDSR